MGENLVWIFFLAICLNNVLILLFWFLESMIVKNLKYLSGFVADSNQTI